MVCLGAGKLLASAGDSAEGGCHGRTRLGNTRPHCGPVQDTLEMTRPRQSESLQNLNWAAAASQVAP